MSTQIPLRCTCGKVRGVAADVSPKHGNRVVCYCADCRAFARFLERPDVLDALGGSDIYQTAPGRLRITAGASELRCLRMSEKGLFRWYAGCCNTPIANTVSGSVPFAGLVQPFMVHEGDGPSRDEVLGAPGYVNGVSAIGGLPAHAHPTVSVRGVLRVGGQMVWWWLSGKGSPSPFFDPKTKSPVVEPRVLSRAEREALRTVRPHGGGS